MNNGIYDEKESFLLYTSFYGLHFADLSNEEKGVLIDCIFQYTLTGRTNFEELEEDRGLKVSFRSIIDVIDRNNAKWAESKERRSNGNKKAWAKRKLGDSRTIEMPNDSFITLKGNIANISYRNKYMVRESNVILCYISHSWGGAAQFVEYAEKQGKEIINLANC